MGSLPWTPWALLAWLVAFRVLTPLPSEPEAWRSRVDVPLALGLGVAFAVAGGWWFPRFYLTGSGLSASDFAQYCTNVDVLRRGEISGYLHQRAYFAGLLPAWFAVRLGVVGGLVAGALVSVGTIGAALFLWGRAVGGRACGVAAVLFATGVPSVVLLTRTTTFYPEQVAAAAVCAAGIAAVLRWRSGAAALLAGVGTGLVLLADVRGLYWGLVASGAVALSSLAVPWRRVLARVALFSGPVAASWWVASRVPYGDAVGLYQQTRIWLAYGAERAHERLPEDVGAVHDFLWGRSGPADVPAALASVFRLSGAITPAMVATNQADRDYGWYLAPWLPVLGAALVVGALLVARRDRWALPALLLPLAPYGAVLLGVARVYATQRYLGLGSSAFALVLAVAWTASSRGERGLLPAPWRSLAAVGLLLLLTTGVAPSWLSPVAPWRRVVPGDQYPFALVDEPPRPDPGDGPCLGLLEADRAAGRWWIPFPREQHSVWVRPPPLPPPEASEPPPAAPGPG